MKQFKQSFIFAAVAGSVLAPAHGGADTQAEPLELGRITVIETAVLPNRTADDLADPVEVLEGRELERRRTGNIGDLLGQELGISSSSFGPGVGRPVIRGQGGSRVQVLENGIRTMDLSTIAADHAVSVDPLNARKVEVIKGPATLLYGSGASGGVVNVLNNRMPKSFAQGMSGNAAWSWSENATARLGSADVTYGAGEFALQGDIGFERNNDFLIPGFQELDGSGRRGVLENSSIDNWSAAISGAYSSERGYLGIALSRLDNDYGIPEVLDPDDPEFERITLDQTRFDLRGELPDPFAGFSRARVAFGFNDYRQEEAEFEDGEREVETSFFNKEWDLRVDFTHRGIGPFTGVLGAQVTERDFKARAEDGDDAFFVPPTTTSSWGLFLIEEMPLDFGRFEVGGRFERNRSKPENDAGVSFNMVSVSTSLVWDIDDLHHVKIALNRAERAPAAEELFSAGRHAATRSFEIGDPELRSERAQELDLGMDRHGSDWEWRVNAFYNRINNYIFQEFEVDEEGGIVMVNDDGVQAGNQRNRQVNYRQHDATFHGLEAETRMRLIDGPPMLLDARLFGDRVHGRLRGIGENLPRITPTRLGIALDGFWGSFDGNVELVRTRAQNRIGQGESATEGFTSLGFDLGYTVYRAASDTRIYLRGRNLLDEEIRLHNSFLKDHAPQPGRSLAAGIRVNF